MDATVKNYLEALEKDAENNEIEQNQIREEIKATENIQNSIQSLSQQPEWPESFVPVNTLAYVPATIVHTGEQYVTLGAEGQILMSTSETINFLERKIGRLKENLTAFQTQKEQLDKRTEFFHDMLSGQQTTNQPIEIRSELGVAHQTAGGFYEIIEPYFEENEKKFYNNGQTSKNKINDENDKESDWYFKRLEQLEKEEMEGATQSVLLNEVKAVIEQTNLYENLTHNQIIQQHCNEKDATSRDVLNKLIVEALIQEPILSIKPIDSDEFKTNDFKVLEFLDNIENSV